MSRIYKIAFARIELLNLFGTDERSYEDALLASWQGGATVQRYRRTWRVSDYTVQDDRILTGQIGFVKANDVDTLEWDEKTNSFVRGQASGGIVIPFGVDVAEKTAAFQLVAGQVRPNSFTGAFEALLTAAGYGRWSVDQIVEHSDYEEWRSSVTRVTSFRFRLEKPNPHYHDNDLAEELIEGFNAEVTTIAATGDDIDTEYDGFQQALDHTRRNYGRAKIRAVDEDGEDSEWRSTNGGVEPAIERVASEEDELPEGVIPRILRGFRARVQQLTSVFAERPGDRDAEDELDEAT